MQHMDKLLTGAGVALLNIGVAATQLASTGGGVCTGICGQCGFVCAGPAVGIASIGIAAVAGKLTKHADRDEKDEVRDET